MEQIISITEVPTLTDGEKRLILNEISALQSRINALPICWPLTVCLVRSEEGHGQYATRQADPAPSAPVWCGGNADGRRVTGLIGDDDSLRQSADDLIAALRRELGLRRGVSMTSVGTGASTETP